MHAWAAPTSALTRLPADPTNPPPPLPKGHNKPSLYSARSTWAGEFKQALLQLGEAVLPSDTWPFYILMAGRSEAATSWKTYYENYTTAFGSAMLYVQDLGSSFLKVAYKRTLQGRSVQLDTGCILEALSSGSLAWQPPQAVQRSLLGSSVPAASTL